MCNQISTISLAPVCTATRLRIFSASLCVIKPLSRSLRRIVAITHKSISAIIFTSVIVRAGRSTRLIFHSVAVGDAVPKSFDKFQDLKYNKGELWRQIKTHKKQIDFVNKAPCETTPKKFSEYFLKPGAKHAGDFFDVCYTENDVLQLRYDIARQFDMDKAVEFREK